MNDLATNLEEYFDFADKDDIRIRGTRVGIETVLEDYLNASSPEEIAVRYPSIGLEQVYATITYYLHNQYEIDQYLQRSRDHLEESWKRQAKNPPPVVKRLSQLKRRKSTAPRKIGS